jgi:signal transduction histidine kinase
MLALVRPDAQKQRVRMVEELPDDLPAIAVDAGQLQQAVLNILLNAIQAMPDGGTLFVGAASRCDKTGRGGDAAPTVRIEIRDTGVGISEENLAKIFSPFYTTKHQGTGLGLAITRSIVEKNQGSIAVSSQPGRGTTFTLEFAACAQEVVAYA